MQHNICLKGKSIVVESVETIDKEVLPYSLDFYPDNYCKRVKVKKVIYYRNLNKLELKTVRSLFARFKRDIEKVGLDKAINILNKYILDAKFNRVTLLPEDIEEIVLKLKDVDKLSNYKVGEYLSFNYGVVYDDSAVGRIYKQAKRSEQNAI
ncbi:hypothetical protein [Peptacetobacter sp. AB845]|uniref:hypothetical protein n=1 Tax=Peptacetobacter sp. AB845 TaxID=3388429 RepID=UPI0039C9A990